MGEIESMNDAQAKQIEAAFRKAVEAAIAKHGIAGLMATSMFLSNERRTLRKAA